MQKKTRNWLLIGGAIAVFATIGAVVGPQQADAPPAFAAAKANVTRSQAYVISKLFAKERLGSADYGWGDDGFTDNGDGTYYVTGVADLPGKRVRWTTELQFLGGDPDNTDNWRLKGYTDNR